MPKLFLVYLLIINIIGFLQMGWDKRQARKRAWRIKESNLFLIALLGGACGAFLGMRYFLHKTKHYSFRFGLPLLIALNFILSYFLIKSTILASNFLIISISS